MTPPPTTTLLDRRTVLTGSVLDGPAEPGLVPVQVRVVQGTVVEGAVDEVAAS